MDFTNKGGSVYHRLLAIYLRNSDGTIVRSIGKQAEQFDTLWSSIKNKVIEAAGDSAETILPELQVSNDDRSEIIHVVERALPSSKHIAGIAINSNEDNPKMSEFEKFFSKLMITQSTIGAKRADVSDEAEALSQHITDLFDKHLRFEGHDDKWASEGRDYFIEHVRYYVSRNIRLDACLPAFPCKSSNTEKVTGEHPDKGEELALRRLHDFVQEVEKIHEPGAKVWIISDGHVFSDCIGVDDSTVDTYGDSLKHMNKRISEELGSDDRVSFRSLVDIFDLRSHVDNLSQVITDLNIPEIDHHVDTEHTEDAEVSRRILMAGCAPDPAALRARIDSNEKSIIALYRGFSRFMLEDLNLHPATKGLSKKKRKKVASSVSFEMIQRNQAYSNLVEMVFPDHLRFSIHAHNNAGPKFGIQLFDTNIVRATNTLEPDALNTSSEDLLHIPTPWHNTVAQVAGDDTLHVVKSKVVEEALEGQEYDGGYVEGNNDEGKGGFYVLKDLTGKVVPSETDQPVGKTDTSDSTASSATNVTAVSEKSAADESTDTDATSIDESTEPEKGTDTKTTDSANATSANTNSKVQNSDSKDVELQPDDILNIPYLRLLGIDADTLNELKNTVNQWADVNVRVPPAVTPITTQ